MKTKGHLSWQIANSVIAVFSFMTLVSCASTNANVDESPSAGTFWMTTLDKVGPPNYGRPALNSFGPGDLAVAYINNWEEKTVSVALKNLNTGEVVYEDQLFIQKDQAGFLQWPLIPSGSYVAHLSVNGVLRDSYTFEVRNPDADKAQALYNKATALADRGLYEEAAEAFRECEPLVGSLRWKLYKALAICYDELEEWDKCLASLKSYVSLASTIRDEQDDIVTAQGRISFIEDSIPFVGPFMKGTKSQNVGDYSSALNAYKQTLLNNPNYIPAYFNMALCYHHLEQWEEALSTYETFVAKARSQSQLLERIPDAEKSIQEIREYIGK